jgi:hypothetical protein
MKYPRALRTRDISANVIPTRTKTDAPTNKGSISFLKKRNKKLLSIGVRRPNRPIP